MQVPQRALVREIDLGENGFAFFQDASIIAKGHPVGEADLRMRSGLEKAAVQHFGYH
jgi:hypothetical protein